ncbi:MAG: PAS domain S-box protein [Planctomycetes bacterium]|nr:PAS domain S-box protein [Planctomycetota bacterium]
MQQNDVIHKPSNVAVDPRRKRAAGPGAIYDSSRGAAIAACVLLILRFAASTEWIVAAALAAAAGAGFYYMSTTLRKSSREADKSRATIAGLCAILDRRVMISEFDDEGNIIYINDAFGRILGGNRETLPFEAWETIRGGAEWNGELSNTDDRGVEHWSDATVAPVRGENNQIKHYRAVRVDVTALKIAKDQLGENESRFRAIADAAPVMIWLANENGEYTDFNKGWLEFTGREVANELGDGWRGGIHTEHRESCARNFKHALERRAPFEIQYRLRSAGGSYRWLSDRGVPRFNSSGEFIGYVGGCMDITELVEADVRQQLSIEIASRLAASGSTQDASRVVNDALARGANAERSAVLLYGDDGVCRFAGWRGISEEYRRAVEGHCPWNFGAADAKPIVIEDVTKDAGLAAYLELFKKEGIAALVFVPVITENGVVGKLMVYDREAGHFTNDRVAAITSIAAVLSVAIARLRAQERLARNERHIRSILDSALDGIVAIDRRGFITDWNAQSEAIFGWSRDEAIGRRLDETIIPAEFRDKYNHQIQQFRPGSGGRVPGGRLEMPAIRKDGSQVLVEIAVTCVESGKDYSFSAFLRDITQRNQNEIELKVAKDRAEEANRTKTEFLANMSHEIRTPMTAILGYADLLSDEKDLVPAHQRVEYVETIRRNGAHLLSIINDILDIAKIESGKMSVESIETAPDQLLHDVLSLMEVKAQEKGLKLQLEYGTPIPVRIQSDPLRLKQILVNLVGNAIKFTEKGTVTLRASIDASAADGPFMLFEVTDTGLGMTVEQMARLFNAFQQADASTTRKFGGSGLGLRISKALASLLGGSIGVRSNYGEGSIFTVKIKTGALDDVSTIAMEAAKHVVRERRPAYAIHEVVKELEGMRILLAEDNPVNQKLISYHLQKAGANVSIVENGKLAVEALTRDGTLEGPLQSPPRFELLLTDMQMPEMDGYTATRLLRNMGCTMAIIALTANAMSGDDEKCLMAGCDGYASKPIDRHKLIETCLHAVAARSAGELGR